MEGFVVEVDVNIGYLYEKNGKNYIFKPNFYTLSKTHKSSLK